MQAVVLTILLRSKRVRVVAALAIAVVTGACNDRSEPRQQPTIAAPAPPAHSQPPAALLRLPNKPGSVRFAAIGDAGRGSPPQYEVSAQMQAYRRVFPFDFVIMLGDNVYDGGSPEFYRQRFELPYKPLLDDGVKFYATIGNHDDPNQLFYPPFNMGGERYYTFKPPSLLTPPRFCSNVCSAGEATNSPTWTVDGSSPMWTAPIVVHVLPSVDSA